MGGAYSELGQFGKAVSCYREALDKESRQSDRTDVPLRLIEQLGNLEVRYAKQLLDANKDQADDPGVRDTPEQLLNQGEHRLQWLLTYAPTPERHALMGGALKRQAEIATDEKEQRAILQQALESYHKAHDLNQEEKRLNPYHTLNWITYEWLLFDDEQAKKKRQEWLRLITQCEEAASEREMQTPDFWNRVQRTDAALLRTLIEGTLTDPQQVTAISDRYTEEFKKRATVRERVTVTEHLTFLATILDARGAESAKIAEALRNIKRALEQTI